MTLDIAAGPVQQSRPGPDVDPLAMTAEEMRRTGYAVIDAMIGLVHQPDPVIRRASPAKMAALVDSPSQEAPLGIDEVLRRLSEDVIPYASKVGHPGYFAYIPGSTTWPAALADFMATVANVYAGSSMEAAGPSQLELTVLEWFRQWIGMPEGTDGVLVSGGSAANLTALAAARELRLGAMSDEATIYCGDQAHSSVGRAARGLGFRPEQVRVVPSDVRFRMRPEALRSAIESDLAKGLRPLAVVAAAGSTNTGAVDPLHEIADLCAEKDVWLHIDAAYGGFAALCARGAAALDGIGRADSVTLDPHKWLYQPMECGALLVRERGALERAFGVLPDYLADAQTRGSEVNFSDRGLQLTRSARSVKVWASLATFGVGAFRNVVDRNFDLTALAQQLIEDAGDLELVSAATLGIVCFRRRVTGCGEEQLARVNAWLASELETTGRAMVSATRLHGRASLRMCVLNHLTQESDIRWTVDFLARTPIPASLLDQDDPSKLQQPEGFSDKISPTGRRLLASRSFVRTFPAGSTIVARWATDRDFYVVLAGALSAVVDGQVVRTIGPATTSGRSLHRTGAAGTGTCARPMFALTPK